MANEKPGDDPCRTTSAPLTPRADALTDHCLPQISDGEGLSRSHRYPGRPDGKQQSDQIIADTRRGHIAMTPTETAILYAYVFLGLCAWLVNAGLAYAYFQSKYPTTAKETAREDLGIALAYGAYTALFWPLGTPLVWLLSGFAKYGWRLK